LAGVLRLITIPISHYCEKARWALDRAGIEYREERHIQGVHMVAARRAGGGITAPVLVTPDRVLTESADILEWVDGQAPPSMRLFPAERDEVDAACRRFDEKLGPHGRRLMYVYALKDKELVLSFNNAGVPRWEDRLIRTGWPIVLQFAKRRLDIRPGVEKLDERIVWDEFDYAAELLADGRPYLCGERFTAADLTFAALAAPVVVPPEYTVRLPQPEDEVPQEPRALIERFREHPGGAHALRMFTQHRRERAAVPG
jgi:glutathione S-transferase